MERMSSAISEATSVANVRSVVITGAGERVFCAGVDVREKPEDGTPGVIANGDPSRFAANFEAQWSRRSIVAALNGVRAFGAMIALLADSCVAADTAALTLFRNRHRYRNIFRGEHSGSDWRPGTRAGHDCLKPAVA